MVNPEKMKATYYLSREALIEVDRIQAMYFRERSERIDKSAIVQAAILAYAKQFPGT